MLRTRPLTAKDRDTIRFAVQIIKEVDDDVAAAFLAGLLSDWIPATFDFDDLRKSLIAIAPPGLKRP